MSKNIVLYAAPFCGDCQLLKKYMDDHHIVYEYRNIKENPAYAVELEERTGKQGVPFLIIDGEWKRGYVPKEPFSEEFARSLFL